MSYTERTEFGRRLRAARQRRGFTQDALARRAGIDRSLISRWESGDRGEPRLRHLTALQRGLPCTWEELLGPRRMTGTHQATGCHCLCVAVHPDERGICTGEATRKVPFQAELGKVVQVWMCVPCAEAAKGGR